MVEQAKSRGAACEGVAARKPQGLKHLQLRARPPKLLSRKRKGPILSDASNHALVKKLKAQLMGDRRGIGVSANLVRIEPARIVDV